MGGHDDKVSEYTRRPYTRLLVPEPDGTYRGEILELPGCISTGDTPAGAIEDLEAACWDTLHARYETKRINHSVAFKDKGACTNQAESFFSRLRRAEIGINHRISGQYLNAYASEMAWREDNRRLSNGEQYLITVGAALAHGVSRQWKGYWQPLAKSR